mmetsp:Transcript_8883/g.23968  ORF Transcript_8883/g.23968 Transcript_8883/m.23968 type:complete len:234 (+) Transcript_8883:1782-2483(+)
MHAEAPTQLVQLAGGAVPGCGHVILATGARPADLVHVQPGAHVMFPHDQTAHPHAQRDVLRVQVRLQRHHVEHALLHAPHPDHAERHAGALLASLGDQTLFEQGPWPPLAGEQLLLHGVPALLFFLLPNAGIFALLFATALHQPSELLLVQFLPSIDLPSAHHQAETEAGHERVAAALLDVVPRAAAINLSEEHLGNAPLAGRLEQHPNPQQASALHHRCDLQVRVAHRVLAG